MNFESTVRKNIPNNAVQPRRAQIYVGFQCHQRCGFCYYKSKCSEKMFDLEFIKRQIDFEYDYGIRDFEITGGEPSEYKELRSVCEYIKQKNPNSKIAIITNGGLYSSDVWDLIDELLLSYHISKNPQMYDNTMFPCGSTFPKAAKTIEMAKKKRVLIRTNTVLGRFNIDDFQNIVTDLIEFTPKIVNFLPVNLFDESSGMVSEIDYVKLRPILKSQIDRLKETLPQSLIFVRYMPFCDMNGYERHIVGHLQHIYDWFDWNREIDGVAVLDMVKNGRLETLGRYGSKSFETCFSQRESIYEKKPECLLCKYNIICDGVEKSNGRLLSQVVPQRGVIVKNPLEYIGLDTQNLYRNIYGKLD